MGRQAHFRNSKAWPFSCKCVMLQLQSCACTADSLLEIFSCRLYLIYGVPTYSSRLVFWVCFAPITLSGDSDLQRQNFSVVDLLDGGCSIVSSSHDRTYQETQPPLSSRQHVNARIGAARSWDFSGISAIATEKSLNKQWKIARANVWPSRCEKAIFSVRCTIPRYVQPPWDLLKVWDVSQILYDDLRSRCLHHCKRESRGRGQKWISSTPGSARSLFNRLCLLLFSESASCCDSEYGTCKRTPAMETKLTRTTGW